MLKPEQVKKIRIAMIEQDVKSRDIIEELGITRQALSIVMKCQGSSKRIESKLLSLLEKKHED